MAATARSHTITGLDKTKIYDVQVYGDDSDNKAEALDVLAVPTPPVFSSAEVNEKTLTVTFSGILDPSSVPAPSAFHVTVGTSRRNVASSSSRGVVVLGTKGTLTLVSEVIHSDVVKVRYTKPTASPLQSMAGTAVATFTDQSVTNNTVQDLTPPALSTSAVYGKTLTLAFNEDLDPGFVPAPSVFRVTVNGVRRHVDPGGVAIYGANVILTLASPVVSDQTVTVSYNRPTNNPLQDSAGNQVRDFTEDNLPGLYDTAPISLEDIGGGCDDGATCHYAPTGYADGGPQPGEITVNWTPPASGPTITSWKIEYEEVGTGGVYETTVHGADLRSHTLTGLDRSKRYDVWVSGSNGNAADKARASGVRAAPTKPVFSSARMNGIVLTVTFTESLDPDFVPRPDAFGVTVGKARRNVDVWLTGHNGATVILILTSQVNRFDFVQVRYDDDPKGLRDLVGNRVEAFFDQRAEYDPQLDGIPPEFSSAQVNGNILTVTFNEDLDTESVPAPGDFYVTVGATRRTVDSVAIAGAEVALTLNSPVTDTDTVKVRYTTGTNPLRDQIGNPVATFTDRSVTNNTDTTPPSFLSAAVNELSLKLTFNKDLDTESVPAPGDFYVTVGATRRTVDSVAIADATVMLALATAVTDTDMVWVRYAKPATDPLQDLAGNDAATFGDQNVAHDPQLDGTPPEFFSAEVTGRILTLTFNEDLDTNSEPVQNDFTVTVGASQRHVASFVIADATVTLTLIMEVTKGDTVKVSYTKPSANPLRDLAGNAVATFTDQDVTNTLNETKPKPLVAVAGCPQAGAVFDPCPPPATPTAAPKWRCGRSAIESPAPAPPTRTLTSTTPTLAATTSRAWTAPRSTMSRSRASPPQDTSAKRRPQASARRQRRRCSPARS